MRVATTLVSAAAAAEQLPAGAADGLPTNQHTECRPLSCRPQPAAPRCCAVAPCVSDDKPGRTHQQPRPHGSSRKTEAVAAVAGACLSAGCHEAQPAHAWHGLGGYSTCLFSVGAGHTLHPCLCTCLLDKTPTSSNCMLPTTKSTARCGCVQGQGHAIAAGPGLLMAGVWAAMYPIVPHPHTRPPHTQSAGRAPQRGPVQCTRSRQPLLHEGSSTQPTTRSLSTAPLKKLRTQTRPPHRPQQVAAAQQGHVLTPSIA